MKLAGLAWIALGLPGTLFAETTSTVPTNTIALFNGTNLAGFHTWLVDTKRADPRGVFMVANGLLCLSGDGLGYLATEREFADYHLVAEFRWGSTNWPWGARVGKARDSGLFLHATGPDGNSFDGRGAFMAAIECNIFQGATGDLLLIRGKDADGQEIIPQLTAEVAPALDLDGWHTWRRGARRATMQRWGRLNWFHKDRDWKDQLNFRGPREVEKPEGEWNRLECFCDGSRITVHLNGVVVNEALEVQPRAGRILVQCEGSEIYFRKLELRPLPRRSDNPAP